MPDMPHISDALCDVVVRLAAEVAAKAEEEAKAAAEREAAAAAERQTAAATEEQYEHGAVLLNDAEKLQQVLAGAAFRKIFADFRKNGCALLAFAPFPSTWR